MGKETALVMSFLTMRRCIGVLGIALPFILVLGNFLVTGQGIHPTISAYYHTNMQDFFVGLMCAVSLFLISYYGYDKIDNIVSNICGVFALGVALFPTSIIGAKAALVGTFMIPGNISVIVHCVCAAIFFLILAYIDIFLFTKTGGKEVGKKKRQRNLVYRICGIAIVLAVLGLGITTFIIDEAIMNANNLGLVFETIALIAFGIAWLIKGETLLKDKK